MRYVGDETDPASRLCDLRLTPDDARRACDHAVRALAAMWRAGVAHADCSPYHLLS